MTRLLRVVAATDFSPASDAAVRRAVQLAKTHGAELCLLHAFDAPQLAADAGPDARMQQRLTELAASLAAKAGLEVAVHVALGPLATVIEAFVGSRSGQLVVIGSRADPTVTGLGSTALKVVRQPKCPILIVRVAGDKPYATVMSAVDMRDGSVRAASLAVALFPAAHHHLLHALDQSTEDADCSSLGAEQLRALQETRFVQAEQELQQLAQRLSAGAKHAVAAVVADDAPARAVLVAAANLSADCVAVGHHGQGTATDSYLGSMAQHVIYAALSDVLVAP